MAELKGMTGKIARVDLTSGTVTVIEPEEEVYRKYLGGSALGLYFLMKEGIASPDIHPLSPENLFQVMIGPITGAGPNARSVTVTKSAYNFISIATSGGHAASELKFAGWDGIQVVGKAEKPVYIAVMDDVIEIRDASHVWGKSIEEGEMILKSEVTAELETREAMIRDADLTPEWAALRPPKREGLGKKRLAHVWMIGPAGENQVWFANVMTEGARAHGRYGPGAIMGSKNLKAIVVRGTKGHRLADKANFMRLVKEIQQSELGNYAMRTLGTTNIGSRANLIENGYPVRNWQYTGWADPHIKAIDGVFMDMTSYVRKQACPNCFIHCLMTVEVTSEDPMMDGILTDMPDWEAMGQVGGNLGYFEMPGATPADPFTGTHVDEAENLAKLQFTTFLFDNYGMDFIEGGALLAMLMELRQRELITPEDLDGIDLQWGDVHAVEAIVKKLVYREGIGDVLAKGAWETAKYFAEKKGKPEIMKYPQTGRRYGQPAHGTRGEDKDALEYVTVSRPCEHTGGGGAGFMQGDYAAAIAGQNNKCATDSLVACSFGSGHMAGKVVDLVKAATGWTDFTEEDLFNVGARQYAMARLFDIHTQQLKDPKEEWDKLVPDRWFDDPIPFGIHKGETAYDGDRKKLFDEALPAYWRERGWTEDKGIPKIETLKALGLPDEVVKIAEQHL
jgi:aldehyde:ferredoxin oxidoreductase